MIAISAAGKQGRVPLPRRWVCKRRSGGAFPFRRAPAAPRSTPETQCHQQANPHPRRGNTGVQTAALSGEAAHSRVQFGLSDVTLRPAARRVAYQKATPGRQERSPRRAYLVVIEYKQLYGLDMAPSEIRPRPCSSSLMITIDSISIFLSVVFRLANLQRCWRQVTPNQARSIRHRATALLRE